MFLTCGRIAKEVLKDAQTVNLLGKTGKTLDFRSEIISGTSSRGRLKRLAVAWDFSSNALTSPFLACIQKNVSEFPKRILWAISSEETPMRILNVF